VGCTALRGLQLNFEVRERPQRGRGQRRLGGHGVTPGAGPTPASSVRWLWALVTQGTAGPALGRVEGSGERWLRGADGRACAMAVRCAGAKPSLLGAGHRIPCCSRERTLETVPAWCCSKQRA